MWDLAKLYNSLPYEGSLPELKNHCTVTILDGPLLGQSRQIECEQDATPAHLDC